jgi:hypothetical protein
MAAVVRQDVTFAVYTGDWFERAVSRQAEFLARHLS